MVLLIDNYDSFVYNLARYVRELGYSAEVCRNDELTVEQIADAQPTHVIISPGPCTPREAGISVEVVRRLGPVLPMLGVCLGHQCIGAAYGGEIVRAGRPMHGRTSVIRHDGSGVFAGLPAAFTAARYHSMVIDRGSLPGELEVTAVAEEDGEIMAVAHRSRPVVGVQFHPESAATQHGHALLRNFLDRPSRAACVLDPRATNWPSSLESSAR